MRERMFQRCAHNIGSMRAFFTTQRDGAVVLYAVDTLEQHIDGHREELLAFVARRAPSRAEAEELVQETFLRIARSKANLPTDTAFRAYMYTVARRLLIDHHRRRAARVQLVPIEGGQSQHADPGQNPETSARAGQILDVVQRVLAQMKPEIAAVWRWRMTEDADFKTIARRQGTGINTALGRMHRATRTIARALEDAGLKDTP